jgi:hypothetical protein
MMPSSLGPAGNIALDIICRWLGESRYNRTMEEYRAIARKMPKLDAMHAYVNEFLAKLHARSIRPYQICHFKAGDLYTRYEDFPRKISKETIRQALIATGFRQLMADKHL